MVLRRGGDGACGVDLSVLDPVEPGKEFWLWPGDRWRRWSRHEGWLLVNSSRSMKYLEGRRLGGWRESIWLHANR